MSTTTSVPRDVVVALDISNSMRGDKLKEAKGAVLTVMETLSVKDNVCVHYWSVSILKYTYKFYERQENVLFDVTYRESC